MKPKPLHRSLTFWSGIFVMTFICFVWWDSMKISSRANSSSWLFTSQAASVQVWKGDVHGRDMPWRAPLFMPHLVKPFPGPYLIKGKAISSLLFPEQPEEYSRQVMAATDHEDLTRALMKLCPDAIMISIPHWLLLLIAAAGWIGLLFWRARRYRVAQTITGPTS